MPMKQEIIQQISTLMKEHDISLNDIALAIGEQPRKHFPFDLLCKIENKLKRLPFDVGKMYNPIAIFPSLDSNMAIMLEETSEEVPRINLEESNIPTYRFWEEIFLKRKALNDALRELGTPIIDGCYFAEPMIGSRASNIIAIKPEYKTLAHDNYGINETAKVRYCVFFTYKQINGVII